jgi:hypothetical protein
MIKRLFFTGQPLFYAFINTIPIATDCDKTRLSQKGSFVYISPPALDNKYHRLYQKEKNKVANPLKTCHKIVHCNAIPATLPL